MLLTGCMIRGEFYHMVSLTRQPGVYELSLKGLEASPDRQPQELHIGDMPKS